MSSIPKFQLNPLATSGFHDASKYDTHRPSYPPKAVEELLSNLRLSGVPNARVIDLASGTGKFTELLARREERYEIVAVEPHDQLRGELVKKGLNGVELREGNAAEMGVEEGWADGVIAAQAFHWFATEDSLKEIHRVLRPGGAFGMIWNIEDYNAPKDWQSQSTWEESLKQIIASLEDGHPRFRHGKWREAFENQQDTNPFQTIKDTLTGNLPSFSLPLGEESVEWTVWLSDEAVWDRFSTLSQIANTEGDGEKFEDIKKQVFEALKVDGTERNDAGEVAVHGRTYLAWTSRV